MAEEKPAHKQDALTVALRFLSYRPRSVYEASEKLKSKGFSEPEINSALDYLLKSGYLDDEKFADLLLGSRTRNKNWGLRKITAELDSKGISKDIIKKIVGEVDSAQEAQTAKAAFDKWVKKNRAQAPLERKEFEKAFRFLHGRGFSTSAIFSVLNGFKNDSIE
ncbi:MAG: regulatory protein RecX [Deltaproteobacteria bacterium]|nr:regulatory protein RecX [Deltaproteobacteria bacterium]